MPEPCDRVTFFERSCRVGPESQTRASESMSFKSYDASKFNTNIPSIAIREMHFLFLDFLKYEQRARFSAKNLKYFNVFNDEL